MGEIVGMVTTGPNAFTPPDRSTENDRLPVRFQSGNPELVVWHPNGSATVQFHNGRFSTAHPEWIQILRNTPEVEEVQ